MKEKTKILKIEEVVTNQKLYPRIESNQETSQRYADAMSCGAEFPKIVVAEKDGKYILVDGKHRLNAFEINRVKIIEAEVLYGLSDKEIFIESVKRNINHGIPFSEQDINEIKITLEDFNLGIEEVSSIVRIPIDKLSSFVAKEIESHYDEGFSNLSFPQQEIDESKLIGTQRAKFRELERKRKLADKYSFIRFIDFLFFISEKIEDYIANIPDLKEINEKYNRQETERTLSKINEAVKTLNRLKKVLGGLVDSKGEETDEIREIRKSYKSRMQELLTKEKELNEVEDDKNNDLF